MNQNAFAVLAEVAERVKGSNISVRSRVVEAMVEREVSSRADLLAKSVEKLSELTKALKKLGPDQVSIAADGVKNETYSKARWEEQKKAKERADKLEKAIANAMGDGLDEATLAAGTNDGWAKLKEALQKAGQAGGEDKNSTEQ